MLTAERGFPAWVPILTSLTNFTGTGQFAGIDLLTAGAAAVEIAFTVLIINLRYMLMSLSLSQKLSPSVTRWQRFVIAFGNTDEVYAVAMQHDELNFRYMIGLITSSYLGWNGGTVLGVVASGILPSSLQSALGIALYAMFIAIVIPPARDSKPITQIILISMVMSGMFAWVPVLNQLSSGWVIIICGVVSSAIGAYLHPIKPEETSCTDGKEAKA